MSWHLALPAALVMVLVGLAVQQPPAAIVLTLGYLILLGDLRRLVNQGLGYPVNDPLLLVAPLVVLFLLAAALVTRRVEMKTSLGQAVAGLMALMVLQMLNPVQGGLAAGVAGALFYLVPLAWFWVGRAYGSEALVDTVILRLVLPMAVAASLLGLYQTFVGFLPFERLWIEHAGYAALSVGGVIRPISFFTSAAEYARFLGLALALVWAGWLSERSGWILLAPLFLVALFLESSRTVLAAAVAAGAALWAVQGRSTTVQVVRLAGAVAVAAGVVVYGLGALQGVMFSGPVQALVEHQVGGLLDPLNPERSTLGIHAAMVREGFLSGFSMPLGHGLGYTTLAGGKFGGTTASTEVDLTDMMVALGLPGGVLYAGVIGMVLARAVRLWNRTRSPVALRLLASVLLPLGFWLIGGEYAISALTWFFIGNLDRMDEELRHPDGPAALGWQPDPTARR